MKNIALFNEMISKYNQFAFTHEYIFGFTLYGNVYMVKADSQILPFILKLDKASRGQGYSLRFKPTNAQKALLMGLSPELICSVEYFNDMVTNSKYNKGDIFEKLIANKYGQDWKKDSTKFTEAGDLEVNGIPYQVKFEKATFTNEKTLAGLA